MKLRIRQTDLSPFSTRVWLGDQEITNGLSGLTVEISPGRDITRATLSITVDDLDVDAETIAVLQARLDEKQPEREEAAP